MHGDDFADDLQHGAKSSDYEADAPQREASSDAGDEVSRLEARARTLVKGDIAGISAFCSAVAHANLNALAQEHVLEAAKAATGGKIEVLRKQVLAVKQEMQRSGGGAGILPAWGDLLRKDLFQQIERNEVNVITAFSNDHAFAGAIVFDEFRQEVMIMKSLPWSSRDEIFPRPWADVDDIKAAAWLQRMGINVTPAVVSRGVQAVASDFKIHPVREYLASLRWDGVGRLERWVIDFLGAEDAKLNRAFGALWMISAVARVMKPGTKCDHSLILEGPQGAKKSTALKTLVGADFFTDELSEVGSKDAAMQVRGVWVIEIAELNAFSRAEVNRIKAFLTRTTDRYRPPYGRYVVSVDRQCIFAGTVNQETYLRDENWESAVLARQMRRDQ